MGFDRELRDAYGDEAADAFYDEEAERVTRLAATLRQYMQEHRCDLPTAAKACGVTLRLAEYAIADNE